MDLALKLIVSLEDYSEYYIYILPRILLTFLQFDIYNIIQNILKSN